MITLFAVITFLLPFILKYKFRFIKIIAAVIILYAISLFRFVAGKELNFLIYCRFCWWKTIHLILLILFCVLIFAILGFGYWLTICRLLHPIKKFSIILISTYALCVIPLSLLTSHFFPLSNESDWVTTVKSGFPVFWITFLHGIAGIQLANQKK